MKNMNFKDRQEGDFCVKIKYIKEKIKKMYGKKKDKEGIKPKKLRVLFKI